MTTPRFYKFRISFISSSYHLKYDEIIIPSDALVLDIKKRINDLILPKNNKDLIIIYEGKKLFEDLEVKAYFLNINYIYHIYVYRNCWSRYIYNFLKNII